MTLGFSVVKSKSQFSLNGFVLLHKRTGTNAEEHPVKQGFLA
jgi:hypothetical protein